MREILRKLDEWGCDWKGALGRFLGDEDLYVSCLFMLVEDPAFERLGEELRKNCARDAFASAHTLKGAIANMGITPMFDTVTKLVEPLRREEQPDMQHLLSLYRQLLDENGHLKELLVSSGEERP